MYEFRWLPPSLKSVTVLTDCQAAVSRDVGLIVPSGNTQRLSAPKSPTSGGQAKTFKLSCPNETLKLTIIVLLLPPRAFLSSLVRTESRKGTERKRRCHYPANEARALLFIVIT